MPKWNTELLHCQLSKIFILYMHKNLNYTGSLLWHCLKTNETAAGTTDIQQQICSSFSISGNSQTTTVKQLHKNQDNYDYKTIRESLTCNKQLIDRQLHLLHRTKNRKIKQKNQKEQQICFEDMVLVIVCGGSLQEGDSLWCRVVVLVSISRSQDVLTFHLGLGLWRLTLSQ